MLSPKIRGLSSSDSICRSAESSTHPLVARQAAAGFTLVELSIVLVIIGLLVGGILKAQQLIQDARIGRTVTQVEAFRTAAASFVDRYGALPGDFSQADARVSGVASGDNGNGNGRIDGGGNTGEGLLFWEHLARAGLIIGDYDGATAQLGVGLPSASVGGGFNAGQFVVQGLAANWLLLGNPTSAGATTNALLTPEVARRMDARVDDGQPTTGAVRTPTADCIDDTGNYAVATSAEVCTLAFRL
ncbi:MAG: hypothetical protein CMM50_17570 [Rhodospirillaceae bacterium]|nr:hypothetical protein [Rhodospirillaceae bacterium]